MPRFERFQAKDVELNLVQENVSDALEPLLTNVLAGAILTDELSLTTSAQNVSHKLGRKPRGWLVVAPSADARVWGSLVSGLEDRLLSLTASAAVTCRLVVF